MGIHTSLSTIYIHALSVWFVLLVAMFIHGALRSTILAPKIGDFPARQVSVFTGSVLILLIVFAFVRWIGATSSSDLLKIGLMWLVLTFSFEIGLGLVLRKSLSEALEDFNLLRGGLFPILLAVLTLSPLITARLRGIR